MSAREILTINEPFVILCKRVNSLVERYADQGINFEYINVGGGLGVDYDNPDANPVPDFESYFGTFRKHLAFQAVFRRGRSSPTIRR